MKTRFMLFCFLLNVLILATIQINPVWGMELVFKNFWGKAIRGYDPVAYFKQGKAVKGQDKFQYEWKNAKWYFSSQQNKEDFIQSPESYAPQYGGYCAWAVSQGYMASTDPEAWLLHNGKLYLNYSKKIQEKWSKDIPGNIKRADQNWPELLSKE